MKDEMQRLSDANYEIMRVLWEAGEATVQAITNILNTRRKNPIKSATIQVQVTRLARYGWLKRRRAGKNYFYYPTRTAEETSRDILFDMQSRIFSGSAADLVLCLISTAPVSRQELERIQEILTKVLKEGL